MPGINLLKKNQTKSVEEIGLRRNIYTISSIGFVFLLIISITVFVLSSILSKKYDEYLTIEKNWTDKIASMSEIESLNLVLKNKIEAIKKIKAPFDYEEIFTVLDNFISPELKISSLDLNSDGIMSISGDSTSSTALMNFFDGLINGLGSSLRSAVLSNLVLSKDGNYKFSMSIEFVKNK